MHRPALFLLVAFGILLLGCDSTDPDAPSNAGFEATLGAPVSTTLEGDAGLGNETSFSNGDLFTFTLPGHGEKTFTAIQLFDTSENGVPHDLSFLHLADERLGEGTYEVGAMRGTLMNGGAPLPVGDELFDRASHPELFPDTLFTASYGRRTPDSLFTYTLDGRVTIETAEEARVEGTFELEATRKLGVHRDSLRAFIESLRARDEPSLLSPPPVTVQTLDPPMPIDGRFTAVPRDFDNRVPHVNWMPFGGPFRP